MKLERLFLIFNLLCASIAVIACSSEVVSLNSDSVQGVIIDTNTIIADLSNVGVGLSINHYTEANSVVRPTSFKDVVIEMKLKSLRWPEGELGETYLWSQPPYTESNPTASMWGPVSPFNNSSYFDQTTHVPTAHLNFDDFMTLCEETGTEPFVIIPVDAVKQPDLVTWYASEQQILDNAVQMVRYAKLKGYKLKYYEIGNECDLGVRGASSSIVWSSQEYANFVVKISRLMKAEDPTIKIGVNGQVSWNWWGVVLQTASADIDFLVTHQYISNGTLSGNGTWYDNYRTKVANGTDFIPNITRVLSALRSFASPADQSRLKIAVTETSSYTPGATSTSAYPDLNCFGTALITYEMMRNMLNTNKIITLDFWSSHYGNKITIRNSLDSNNNLLPTGMALKLMAESILPSAVTVTPTTSFSLDPDLNVSAYYDREINKLNIVVVNRSSDAKNLNVILPEAYESVTSSLVTRFSGISATDTTTTLQSVDDVTIDADGVVNLNLPAYSITLYSFQISSPSNSKVISSVSDPFFSFYKTASGFVIKRIDSSISTSNIFVYDQSGIKQDVVIEANNDQLIVRLKNERSGCYFVKVNNGKTSFTQKIMF